MVPRPELARTSPPAVPLATIDPRTDIRTKRYKVVYQVPRHKCFFSYAFLIITAPKRSQGTLKNGLERRVSRLCTLYDKNHPLTKDIEKIWVCVYGGVAFSTTTFAAILPVM